MRKNIFSTLLIIIVFSFVACGNTLPKDLKDFTVELDGGNSSSGSSMFDWAELSVDGETVMEFE